MKIKASPNFYLFLFLASIIISCVKGDEDKEDKEDNTSLENLENLINLVDARLDVIEKVTMYKYLEGLPVRSTNSEYAFLYNAYILANNTDFLITNFFQSQLYASQIAQAS
uniref:DUF4296 domain-containing protein n=1 Tax=Meloidogyne hapla TaxID=6305 RepID=A0A1I8BWL2_MELHA